MTGNINAFFPYLVYVVASLQLLRCPQILRCLFLHLIRSATLSLASCCAVCCLGVLVPGPADVTALALNLPSRPRPLLNGHITSSHQRSRALSQSAGTATSSTPACAVRPEIGWMIAEKLQYQRHLIQTHRNRCLRRIRRDLPSPPLRKTAYNSYNWNSDSDSDFDRDAEATAGSTFATDPDRLQCLQRFGLRLRLRPGCPNCGARDRRQHVRYRYSHRISPAPATAVLVRRRVRVVRRF